MEVLAQILSIMGMTINVISFQQKTQKGVIVCQFLGGLVFAVSYLLLGAYMGALLNFLCILRSIVFNFKEKTHATSPIWFISFVIAFIACYLLVFTAFGKEPTTINFLIEALPVIGMTAHTFAYMKDNAKIYRQMSLISSPAWLVYNLISRSIGGTICEIISLLSIVIGIIRHDIKKEPPTEN